MYTLGIFAVAGNAIQGLFEWFQFDFMRSALLAIVLIAPVFGLLSTMIVSNKMAFLADALGHGAFTGVAIGAVFGFFSPFATSVLFAVAFAALVTLIKFRSNASADTIIGVFSSIAVAFGLILISYNRGLSRFSSFLVGDILSVSTKQLTFVALIITAFLVIWLLIFNRLVLIGINSSLAASRGVKTFTTELIFTTTLAAVITATVSYVGLLMINSLLVLPGAAAKNIAANLRQFCAYSLIISLISGILGLFISYYTNTVASAMIVIVAAAIYFITLVIKRG